MLINYLKIAFRALLKFKGYASINLVGLSLGLSASILIMLYVLDEISYDQFHTKGDRVYRVTTSFYTPESGEGALTKPMAGLLVKSWRKTIRR
jgi:putative ABC transport system permease protein